MPTWHVATLRRGRPMGPRARTLQFAVPTWPGHLAGQHTDVRLTAADGYRAVRAYSIASAPSDPGVELTVERVEDGEVSPYLVDEMRPGDRLELSNPIGGLFVHDPARRSAGPPVALVAGGSGIVPLRAMLRHRVAVGARGATHLVWSARTAEDLLHRDELLGLEDVHDWVRVVVTLTRGAPPGWTGRRGRLSPTDVAALVPRPATGVDVFVCGPTGFVEMAASALLAAGHPFERVRTERFGPSGG